MEHFNTVCLFACRFVYYSLGGFLLGGEQGIKQAKLTHYSINASSQETDLTHISVLHHSTLRSDVNDRIRLLRRKI